MIRILQTTCKTIVLVFGLAAIAAGQPTTPPGAFTCVANAGTPVIARVEGITELVGDLLLQCVGGAPTPVGQQIPVSNVQLMLNTNITSRLLGGGFTDALLLIDEPYPTTANPSATVPPNSPPQIVCSPNPNPVPGQCNYLLGTYTDGSNTSSGGPNNPYLQPGASTIFQGIPNGSNTITWPGVPIDQGTHTIRFTNVRANAAQLGLSSTLIPTEITGFVAITGGQFFTISNPQQTLAYINQGLIATSRPVTLPQGASLNVSGGSSGNFFGGSAGGSAVTSINIREGFAQSFKRQSFTLNNSIGTYNAYPFYSIVPQNVPGYAYNSESAFTPSQDGANPAPGGDPGIGTAAFGTRILLRFSNVGSGVRLVLPGVVPLTTDNGATPSAPSPPSSVGGWTGGYLVLLGTSDLNGNVASFGANLSSAGVFANDPAFFKGPGAVAPFNSAFDLTGINSGSAAAVYEVVNSDPAAVETANIPIGVAFVSNTAQNLPAPGQTAVNVSFAPLPGSAGGPSSLIPGFADRSTALSTFIIVPASPNTGTGFPPARNTPVYNIPKFSLRNKLLEARYGINCAQYSATISANVSLSSDPNNNASFLNVVSPIIFTVFQPGSTSFITSPQSALDGLTGIGTPFSGGVNYVFSSNNQVLAGYPNSEVDLSFTWMWIPGLPGRIANLKLGLLAGPDKALGQAPTVYTGSGSDESLPLPNNCGAPRIFLDPLALHSGEFFSAPPPDLSLGGPLPLVFRRRQGAVFKANGIGGRLGDNWTHNFETTLAISSTTVIVYLFDGGTIKFNKSGSNWVLDRPQPRPYQLAQSGSNYQFLDASDNLIYTYSSTGALTRIEDRNGNALTITQPSQVSDGLGRTLTLAYGADTHLATVKDQSGRTVSFSYTGAALHSVTDAAGKTTTYSTTTADDRDGLITAIKRPAGNTVVSQTLDSFGRVIRQADGLNNASTIAYGNPSPGTAAVTDPLGDKTQAFHADLMNNNEIIDANGNVTTIVYDGANRPTQITDALGNKTLIAYDPASGLEASRTDGTGAVTTSTYIAQHQGSFIFYVLAKRTYPDGTSSSYTYDATGNLLNVTDPGGYVTSFTYNKQGLVLTETNSAGGVTTHTYNPDGTEASVQSPAGDVTTYGYDALKRRNKVTFTSGIVQTLVDDPLDRVVQQSFGNGTPQTFTYDDNGNLVSQTNPAGAAVTYRYDANDRLLSQTDTNGTSSAAYDAAGRLKQVTNAAGENTSIAYDPVGQPLSILDGAGNGDHFAWNAGGFLRSATDALSQTTTFTTDALGRILSSTTPLGEKTSNTYDQLGRRLSTTTPLSHVVKFTYGPSGALTRVDQPANISASFARNGLNLISSITDPNGGVWTRSYDNLGRLTAASDPLSQTTSVQYGAFDRIIGVSNATGNVSASYDAQGNLSGAQFSDGSSLSYQYSPSGGLSGADNLSLSYGSSGDIVSSNGIATTRDSLHRITSVTYGPGLTVVYKYNNTGDLVEVDDWVGGATLFQYDAAHRLKSVQRPNGTTTTFARDANGLLSAKTENTVSGAYSFTLKRDAEHKVISSDRNLPQLPQPAGGFVSYSFDAAHQVIGSTYDAAGRLVADALRTYTWDLASRLRSYSGSDGAAQFTYDGLGLRVSRTTAAGEQDYVWNYAHDLPALAIVRSAGADLRYYVYLPSGTLVHSIEAADNSRHFYHFDEQGSTTFLTDDSGVVSDSYGITPFGESVTHNGSTDNPFTFQGAFGVMQEGATSLYYMRARYYDTATVRFISRDALVSLDPQRINPYAFALNNPVSFSDPSGMSPLPQYGKYGCGKIGSRLLKTAFSFYQREGKAGQIKSILGSAFAGQEAESGSFGNWRNTIVKAPHLAQFFGIPSIEGGGGERGGSLGRAGRSGTTGFRIRQGFGRFLLERKPIVLDLVR
ncbi:MAG TPA: RHS repeat-associated core domain-containing protein [Bryobacteraceae bacterium]|nr:RHS repeat-associated core domain-containing protein [Bryobacteraceae bacterium]